MCFLDNKGLAWVKQTNKQTKKKQVITICSNLLHINNNGDCRINDIKNLKQNINGERQQVLPSDRVNIDRIS